jgi:hypothetical protein
VLLRLYGPVSEVIDIISHPDRTLSERRESKGEWRDLLFVWVSTHATRCGYALILEKIL